MFPHELEGLWEGEWPYYSTQGVGLRFDGIPTDREKFIWVMAQEGCHPKGAERILSRLRENSFSLMTVMRGLHFHWIKKQLGDIGIRMTVVPPQPNWEPKFDDGPWPDKILSEALSNRYNR